MLYIYKNSAHYLEHGRCPRMVREKGKRLENSRNRVKSSKINLEGKRRGMEHIDAPI